MTSAFGIYETSAIYLYWEVTELIVWGSYTIFWILTLKLLCPPPLSAATLIVSERRCQDFEIGELPPLCNFLLTRVHHHQHLIVLNFLLHICAFLLQIWRRKSVSSEKIILVLQHHCIHSKSGKSGGDGYFGQQKLAEKVLKSRQNKNRDKSA